MQTDPFITRQLDGSYAEAHRTQPHRCPRCRGHISAGRTPDVASCDRCGLNLGYDFARRAWLTPGGQPIPWTPAEPNRNRMGLPS